MDGHERISQHAHVMRELERAPTERARAKLRIELGVLRHHMGWRTRVEHGPHKRKHGKPMAHDRHNVMHLAM